MTTALSIQVIFHPGYLALVVLTPLILMPLLLALYCESIVVSHTLDQAISEKAPAMIVWGLRGHLVVTVDKLLFQDLEEIFAWWLHEILKDTERIHVYMCEWVYSTESLLPFFSKDLIHFNSQVFSRHQSFFITKAALTLSTHYLFFG